MGRGALRAAALDAALVLDAEIPEPLLRAVASRVGETLVLLLAARRPATYADLLRPMLRSAMDDDHWTAVCNLLLPLRDVGLLRHLLGRVEFEAHVLVRDDVPEEEWSLLGGSGAVSRSRTGCGRIPAPPVVGWPPRHGWDLRSTPGVDGRLVAPGREPIFAVRREWTAGGFSCVHRSEWSRTYDAEAYLAEFLGVDTGAFRSYLSNYTDVRFTDLPALEQAVAAAGAERRRAWSLLVALCLWQNRLSAHDAADLRPRIVVKVRDGRAIKDPALPPSLGD